MDFIWNLCCVWIDSGHDRLIIHEKMSHIAFLCEAYRANSQSKWTTSRVSAKTKTLEFRERRRGKGGGRTFDHVFFHIAQNYDDQSPIFTERKVHFKTYFLSARRLPVETFCYPMAHYICPPHLQLRSLRWRDLRCFLISHDRERRHRGLYRL